jgi:hypothetical protein
MSKLKACALIALTMTAMVIGSWALVMPRAFYDWFPLPHHPWISVDGPYNEHLVRDVGAFYLAFAVAGLLVPRQRRPGEVRILGAAWTAFSVPHLWYHLHHLACYTLADQIGLITTLGGTLLLALALLWPSAALINEASRRAESQN